MGIKTFKITLAATNLHCCKSRGNLNEVLKLSAVFSPRLLSKN